MVNKKCMWCGTYFKISPSRRNKAKYCSHECYWKSKVGKKESREANLKRRLSLMGHPVSEEAKKKISARLKGHKVSLQTRQKISKSKKGSKWSAANRESHKNCHSGTKHYNWKGGRRLEKSNGYSYIFSPNHPKSHNNIVLEQKIIAEKCLNRYLTNTEVVHHVNFKKSDNRPKNLFVFENNSEHLRYHLLLKNNPFLKKWLKSNII